MQWANIRKTVSGQGIKPHPMCRHPRRAGGKKAKKAIQLTQKKKKKRKKHQWLTKPTILDRCETEYNNAQRHNTRPKLAKAVEKTMNQECLDATSKGNLGN
jgi:hypothetical protein